jgi:hypothetical protein
VPGFDREGDVVDTGQGQMNSELAEHVGYYLEQFRRGDREDAYQGLLELGPEMLPCLISTVRAETNLDLKRVLLEIVWQYRDSAAVPFLLEMLDESDPAIWKEALDGLVTLASPDVLDALESRFCGVSRPGSFAVWLDEAIEQVREAIRLQADSSGEVFQQ